MHNPFIFFEMNFDPDIFQKYYGSIDSPGIYAIPEDEVEPADVPDDEKDEFGGNKDPEEEKSRLQKNLDDREKIQDQLANTPDFQAPQLNPDEQAAFNREVEPVKKAFLIKKLQNLSHLLKSKFSFDSDLDLILRYSSSLSYKTLYMLSISVLQNLKEEALQREQQQVNIGGDSEQNVQNIATV